MKGCLTLPFRLLGLALLAAGLYLAWIYRDDLRRRIHAWTADSAPPSVAEGRADPSLVPGVRQRLGELGGSRRDTVLLTAAELASLIAEDVGARFPRALDSVEVRLDPDVVEVRALVDTRKVRPPLGPAAAVLRDWERVEAGGRLTFRRAGIAEWQIGWARVRGLPIPASLVEGLLRQLSGTAAQGAAEIPLPPSVGGLRVARTGLVLYGPNPPRR